MLGGKYLPEVRAAADVQNLPELVNLRSPLFEKEVLVLYGQTVMGFGVGKYLPETRVRPKSAPPKHTPRSTRRRGLVR